MRSIGCANKVESERNSSQSLKQDLEAVPAKLRDLLSFALTWGIGDDVIRDDWHQKAGEADKEALVQG